MELLDLLKLNLQFFSQDDPGGSNPSDDNPEGKEDDPPTDDPEDKKDKKDEPTFTQEQVDDIVKDRIKRAEQDKEKAVKEAEKLAKMTADQKREYEFEKLQRENEQLKQSQNRFELGKVATSILAETGITANDEILDFVVREDAETTSEAVKAFSELVDKISDERMKEKLKGTSPKRQKGAPGALTKEQIMKEPDSKKRQRMIRENSHLFQ